MLLSILSDEIISQTENDNGYTTEELQQLLGEANSDARIPVNIPGHVATWAPNSGYKATCLLEFCRFHAEKPPAAVKREGDAKRRIVYNSTGCAEWAGYVDLAGRNCPGVRSFRPYAVMAKFRARTGCRRAIRTHIIHSSNFDF